MKTSFKIIPVLVALSMLLASCNLPFSIAQQRAPVQPQQPAAQPVTPARAPQVNPPVNPPANPPAIQPTNPPASPQGGGSQEELNSLMATISALETSIAANSQAVEEDSADTPEPKPTVKPTKTPKPTSEPEDEDEDEDEATDEDEDVEVDQYGVPVVQITPISPYYERYSYNPYNAYNPYYYRNMPPWQSMCNLARFVADVTIADDTRFSQGDNFTKTWRLRNEGSCTWTTDYKLVFDYGDKLGGPSHVDMPRTVHPGETVDVSVDLEAPNSDGNYQGFWKLADEDGHKFGIGANAQVAFWVKIRVGSHYYNPYDGYYDGYNGYPYGYPYGYPPYGNQNGYQNNPPDYDHDVNPSVSGGCELVSSSPKMYSTFDKNSDIDIRWTIRNTSGKTWHEDEVDYKYISGTKMYKYDSVYDLPEDVSNHEKISIAVDTKMPSERGTYTTTWGLVKSGKRLCTMSMTLKVH
jgi:hypothetical protein